MTRASHVSFHEMKRIGENDYRDTVELPDELWILILRFLSNEKRFPLSTVSKAWSEFINKSVVCLQFEDDSAVLGTDLKRFPHLTELSIMASSINDDDIKGLKILNKLAIWMQSEDYEITDMGIKELTNLTHLDIPHNYGITNHSISKLVNLTHLDIYDSLVSGDGIKYLTKLTWLNLDGDSFFDEDLCRLTNLQTLSLNNTGISNECLSLLTNLTRLNIKDCYNITTESIALLVNLVGLNYGEYMHDHDILNLVNLTRLKELSIMYGSFSNGSIAQFTNLTHLEIDHCADITDEGISRLTNLMVLTPNHNITINSLFLLTNLKHLDILHCTTITDQELSLLTNLTSLTLHEEITDSGIQNLTNLTHLDMKDCDRITWKGLENLVKLESVMAPEKDTNLEEVRAMGLLPFFH